MNENPYQSPQTIETVPLREFIGDGIRIDGRMISYRIFTAHQYLSHKNGWTEDQCHEFVEKDFDNYQAYLLLSQIMALKQSCFLLRRTTHSCQSLSDNLYDLKLRLINELKENHNIEFDDDFVERDGI